MNHGIAVSQPGYDVKTAADRLLLFSSAFQTLKIFSVSSVNTTIPASGTNTITVSHNLGYLAPFIVIYNGSTTLGQTKSYFMADSDGDYLSVSNGTNSLTISVPDDFDSSGSSVGDTVYFTVYVFLDDFSTVSQATINSSTSSSGDSNNYGFRVSKEGKSVITCDDVDLVASSSFFSHIVHRKGIDTSGDITVSISHNLGYVPAALVYLKSGTSLVLGTLVQISSSSVSVTTGGGVDIYYIIFKNQNE